MASVYDNMKEGLATLGFDCSNLTDDQMDQVGMNAENAGLDWDWATADDEGCETRVRRIIQAKEAVECTGCMSEGEMIANAVGATFDDLGIRR
jgi:hypothetical protein